MVEKRKLRKQPFVSECGSYDELPSIKNRIPVATVLASYLDYSAVRCNAQPLLFQVHL
jgi:hypothetical protein